LFGPSFVHETDGFEAPIMSRQRVLVVTAGRHQRPLIKAAKEMGHQVIATDSHADAPGLALADDAAIVDATDLDELLRVASAYRIDAILSEQTDVGVRGAAYVAERLGLPGIGIDTALRATDKWFMRKACTLAGLPMPEYRLATSVENGMVAARDVGLPIIVKPTDNQSSRGVTKVADMASLPAAIQRALASSRSKRILVEECMFGQESSIESFVIGNKVHVLGICEKVKCPPPYSFDLELVYSASFSAEVMNEIEEVNRRVVRAVGMEIGFAHAEMMVTPEGVRLIEIAARGCGARIATDLLPELTGVDLLGLRLKQALGEPVQMQPVQTGLSGICRFFDIRAGTVRHIDGLKEAGALAGVIHLEFAPTIGTRLERAISGDQRPGFVLAAAESRSAAVAIADEVTRRIVVDVV
jgi:biotin carboxylase